MTDLEYREFTVRAVEGAERTFSGVAVPWDTPADIAGLYTERFERGSVETGAKVLLYWRHAEPIGLVTTHRDTDAGWEVEARISKTPRGDEAYTLLRDGVVDQLSVGFLPVEHREDDETGDITRTRVEVRETSLVPFGAYGTGATVTNVRHESAADNTAAPAAERQSSMTDDTNAAEVTELRGAIEELERTVSTLSTRDDEPATDTRTAGEILKALAKGDEATTRAYNDMQARAYTGGTSADTFARDGWVGDLSRLVDEASTLRSLFSTGNLPAEGMNIEFAEISANSMDVDEQAAEGDDLSYGEVSVTTRTAPVKTYGGYTSLSRQEIERSSVNILDTNLRALALSAGKRRNTAFTSHFNTAVAAQVTATNTVELAATPDYVDYVSVIIDAAEKFEALGLALDTYVVTKAEFKALAGLTATDGRPLMSVYGSGTNVVGEINAKAIQGNLAGVRVVYAPGVTADHGAFVNRLAIRDYTSPLVRLQDENVVNLSKDFSVYFYSALANEIPGAIVPVVDAA